MSSVITAVLHPLVKCLKKCPRMFIICNKFSTIFNTDPKVWSSYMAFADTCDKECKISIQQNMIVIEEFLNEIEENLLFEEVEPYMKKLHYEFDHWDNAIHGYRETERLKWNAKNSEVIQRVRDVAFPPGTPQLRLVHVLDLAEKGLIKPHIDSVRFCGNTIAGLSLLSNCVMRLIHNEEKHKSVDILLKKRSLYIMRGAARYDFTHEILGNDASYFKGEAVPKGRRLSIICRNEPNT